VKRDGKWLKPLKFLGFIYDGVKDKLSSQTRAGKSLVYDKDRLLEALNERDGLGKIEGRTRMVAV